MRNKLYLDLTVVSLCLVSADIRGLGPQQLETISFDKRAHYYGPGNIIFSILLLVCRPSGEVYQEVTEELTETQVDFWQCHHSCNHLSGQVLPSCN